MGLIRLLATASLLLLLGDFVATFCYHVPEHVFGKFHSIVHHSPKRSFIRYAIKNRQPIALDRKSTRLNSSHSQQSRMPSSA